MPYHYIDTLQCKLQITDKALHKPLQNKLMQFYDTGLFSVLDKVFNKFKTQNLEIPQIQLSLPPIPQHKFTHQFLPLVEMALTIFLETYCKTLEASQKKCITVLPKEDTLTTLIFYLEKGYYPYSVTHNFNDLWEQAIREHPKTLLNKLTHTFQEIMLKRLVYQLTEIKLWELVALALLHPSVSSLQKYYSFLQKAGFPNPQRNTIKQTKNLDFWYDLLAMVLDSKRETLPLTSFISRHLTIHIKNSRFSPQYVVMHLRKKLYHLKDKDLTKFLTAILSDYDTLNEPIIFQNNIDRTTWFAQVIKDLKKEDILQSPLLKTKMFCTLTQKEQELLLLSLPFASIESYVVKKRSYFEVFYKMMASQFSSSITEKQFKDFLFRYAYAYFLQESNSQFHLAQFVSRFQEFIKKSHRIDYTQKQEYVYKSANAYHKLMSKEKDAIFKEKEKDTIYTPSIAIPTSTLVLYFLKYGCFPANNETITIPALDALLNTLFALNTISQWKQQYIGYRHKGYGIYSPVLENYMAQEVHRVNYIILLNDWYPFYKRELKDITKGMQKKQHRQSDFAKQLANTLPEKKIHKIIGYIEPEDKTIILHFIASSISVVVLQSLTDKLTDFKKAIYSFVLSYILLKKGYNFSKKQFVANQIKQLAQHFDIAYNTLLQLFLDTLDPNSSFRKAKELYVIISILKASKDKNLKGSKSPTPLLKTTTKKQSMTPKAWSKLLLYYIKHQELPNWARIKDIETLIQEFPITSKTEEKIVSFLKNQPLITQFLNSKIAQQQNITLDILVQYILQTNPHIPNPIKIGSKEAEITHWTSVLFYYLDHQEFPWWSNYRDLKTFLRHSKTNTEARRKIVIFFQKHKNTVTIWQTVNQISKVTNFRQLLIQWFLPRTTHVSAIHALANLFSPLYVRDQNLFSKHFGVLPDGSQFWKYLWNSRPLFFSDSSDKLTTFWTGMPHQYSLHPLTFNTAALTAFKEQKEAEIWQTIILSAISKSALQSQMFYTDEDFIEKQLFNWSKKISIYNIKQLKNELQTKPTRFVNLLDKILYKKNVSKSTLTQLYTHWVDILFPEIKDQLLAIFKELGVLEHHLKVYTFNDYKLTSLFIWKAVNRYKFETTTLYLQTLFLELSRYKKIPFNDLVTVYYDTIYIHRKTLPELYKGMVLLQLNHNVNTIQQNIPETVKNELIPKNTTETNDIPESIILPNAGIILLWKFLPILFERLHLWNPIEKEYRDDKAKNKGVIILHYLATGNTDYIDEHALLAMKLLSGLPLNFPLFKEDLEEEEKQLVDSLISSAIHQWQKLGTLSIEGFRNTFLTRQGTLNTREEVYLINIQSAGIDVLLDYLPWPISTIRLPWLEKKIHISWREKNSL
ncbi:contractile injection system tape measure protein [Flavivirga jejuensis]|uniref:Contractile injection system tape measure protein n=1 Tax=Flavivirga jejuensis TaxID=870487 RepID=A0ABT8WP13_9FLAO|nr:contractile injection system tape measure protein [Flavivirga jejuensis]MDO5974902.1 contractile injection system tape measure protein [Flavivirga jejuensis]